MRKKSRRAASTLVALAATACAGDPAPPSTSAGLPGATSWCVSERRPLVLADSTEVFLGNHDLIEMGDDLVLAGAPSYHWRAVPGRRAQRLPDYAFAAAYLREEVQMVPMPIAGPHGTVRIADLGGGRFGALVTKIDPDSLPSLEWYRGLFYGEFDGRVWTPLEALEFPAVQFTTSISSGLIRAGDRVVWLAHQLEPREAGSWVRLYERVDGVWSQELLPGFARVEQVDGAYREGLGLWMMVTGPDDELPGDQISIRVYRERSPNSSAADRWELVGRVAVVQRPMLVGYASLVLESTGATVSWTEFGRGTRRTLARVGIRPDTLGTIYELDRGAAFAHATTVPGGGVVWGVVHQDPDSNALEFRLLGLEAGQVIRLASFPSPFTGTQVIHAVTPREVVVVGAEADSDTIGVPVRSLLLRLKTPC